MYVGERVTVAQKIYIIQATPARPGKCFFVFVFKAKLSICCRDSLGYPDVALTPCAWHTAHGGMAHGTWGAWHTAHGGHGMGLRPVYLFLA